MDNKNIKVSIIITYSHKNILFFVIVVWVKHGVLDLRQGEVPHLVEAAGECGLVLSGAPHLTLHTQIPHNYFLKYFLLSPQPHLNIVQQGFPELRQSFVVKSLYFSLGNFRAVLELLLRLVPV